MNLSLVLKIKGVVTVLAGLLFALAPTQLLSSLGSDLGSAGALMTQLFGLILIAVGWALVVSPTAVAAGSTSLVFAITDSVAVVLLAMSVNSGLLGALGYGLAAVYAVSAIIFSYNHLRQKNNPA